MGSYTVTYQFTNANGCSASATDVFAIIPKADKINIYPNPSLNGMANIVVTPDLNGGIAVAYNELGQKVAQWTVNGRLTTYQFNWAVGVYIIKITKGSVTEIKKFIITR